MWKVRYSENWLKEVLEDRCAPYCEEKDLRGTIRDLAAEILDLRQQLEQAQAARPDHPGVHVMDRITRITADGRFTTTTTFEPSR